MAEMPHVWAAIGEIPWVYEPNPGRVAPVPQHRRMRQGERHQILDAWHPRKEAWDTEHNVHRAAYAAMVKSVPRDYHNNPSTGAAEWSINMSMFEIFASLDPYCKPTSDLIEGNEARLVAQYNHTTPIVKLFRRFEECRDIAVANNTAFTTNQLLQKFITLMEKTEVYDDQVT